MLSINPANLIVLPDTRSYFMCKVDPIHWAFMPISYPYTTSIIPIQIWECEKEFYIFHRVCYTHDQAHDMNVRAMLGLTDISEGPDIYCVTNKDNKSIISVWKPNTDGKIEIIATSTSNNETSTYKIDDSITQEEIANKLRVIINPKKDMKVINFTTNSFTHLLYTK